MKAQTYQSKFRFHQVHFHLGAGKESPLSQEFQARCSCGWVAVAEGEEVEEVARAKTAAAEAALDHVWTENCK